VPSGDASNLGGRVSNPPDSTARSSLDRAMRLMLIAGLTALLCGVSLWAWLLYQHNHPLAQSPETDPAPPTIPLSPFTLVDQDGATITHDHFLGKVTILQFMFTSCPLACPAMTNQMQALQKRLKGIPNLQFVSMSFDPAHDTSAVLKNYAADRFTVDESNWRFLTEVPPAGAPFKNTVRSLYANDLHQYIEDKPGDVITAAGSAGAQMPNINHGAMLFLVGPDATVIGIYNSLHPTEMNDLAHHALLATKQLK
jgi:cytochrome oxidase Cu insertion factor (SCO1/SenC/PrrC family)